MLDSGGEWNTEQSNGFEKGEESGEVIMGEGQTGSQAYDEGSDQSGAHGRNPNGANSNHSEEHSTVVDGCKTPDNGQSMVTKDREARLSRSASRKGFVENAEVNGMEI